MKLAFFIYLASMLNSFKAVFVLIAIVTSCVSVFLIVFTFATKLEYAEKFNINFLKKIIKFLIPIAIITSFIAIIIPKKETAYLMAGAYIGNQVATSEFVNNRLEKIIEIIDLNLDKQIKELQGFKK
ncbi:TPA: hypothetical protein RXK40_000892 [Campylobacter jejuni]|nr:hypothetical protein [Campylobacter jejuni]